MLAMAVETTFIAKCELISSHTRIIYLTKFIRVKKLSNYPPMAFQDIQDMT